MENLPDSQDRVEFESLINNVFLDMRTLGREASLLDLTEVVKDLHNEQDLFVFNNGTIAATKKGLIKYERY